LMDTTILRNRLRLPQIFNSVKEALFPARCLACGLFFQAARNPAEEDRTGLFFKDASTLRGSKEAIFKSVLASYVCPACCNNFRPLGSPLCSQCGMMFQSRAGDDHLCGDCLEKPRRFRKARAFGVYDQTLMESIHRFKYKGKVQLARPLGTLLLADLLIYWNDDPPDLAAPVPLHTRRFRERGFNQAFLLIRDWPRLAAALPLQLPDVAIDRELLLRNRRTDSQTGLGRSARRQNINKAFGVRDENRVYRKKILLVDDVYTTGATADECAGTLLNAGAEWVDVLTLARAL